MYHNNHIELPPELRVAIATMLAPYLPEAEARLNELLTPKRDVEPEELLTRKEATARLKISLPTLDRMIKSGEIAHVKIRSSVRVPASAIEELMC